MLGRPMFVLVQDLEMGFEKILKIAHARGGNTLYFKANCTNLLKLILNLTTYICRSMQAAGCCIKNEG